MKKVLIIEDNENNLYLMRKIVQKMGYNVIEARDGATGAELAITEEPTIILLDIQLPVMDGYSVMKKIRENEITKNVIIIIVSSYAMDGDKEKAFSAGCNEYVEKPIDPQSFIETLKKY
jgi:CheY-like chemotaxis protein